MFNNDRGKSQEKDVKYDEMVWKRTWKEQGEEENQMNNSISQIYAENAH